MKRGGKGKDNKKDKMNDKGGKKESEAKIQKPKVGKVRFLLAFVLCMLTTAQKRDRSITLSDQASSGSIYEVEDNDVFLARVLQPQIDDKKRRPSARKQSEVKEAETKPALLDDMRFKMLEMQECQLEIELKLLGNGTMLEQMEHSIGGSVSLSKGD